jgi:hypothetical protein
MSASSVTLSKRLLGTWGRRHVPTWVGESGLVTLLVLLPELWLRVRGDSILTLDALSSNIPLKQLAIDQLMDGRVPLWSSKLAN